MTKLSNKILNINDRRTSMRLCSQEWKILDEACRIEKIHRNKLISLVETNKAQNLGLSYATRLFLLLYFRNLTQDQHADNVLESTLKELL